jgi:RNA polymerase sigma factor (sigma-70 family)
MDSTNELEVLVRNTSLGDSRSEERLFGILYKFVYVTLRKRWRSSLSNEELEDISLECMEKLLATFRSSAKAEKVIEQGRVLGFVHVVAENTALDHNRKRTRRAKVFLSIDEVRDGNDGSDFESRLPVKDEVFDLSDFILGGMEVARMLSELDGKYRTVIEERLGGAEYEEIAEKVGITVANARQIHKRGIGILRQNLIAKHKTILSTLPASQNAVLKRLYTKDGNAESADTTQTTEEDALAAFYAALLNKGVLMFLLTSVSGVLI